MRKLTTDEFISKANEIHHCKFDYSKTKYKNNKIKVTIVCFQHGQFEQFPSDHLRGHGCAKCGVIDVHLTISKKCSDFIEQSNIIHNNRYDYSKTNYISAARKVVIKCHEHGEFEQIPSHHLQGHGCNRCGKTGKLDLNCFITRANDIHDNKYDYSKSIYVNGRSKIIILCRRHGEFNQTPFDHLRGKGCPRCQNTYKQNKWLDILGIPDDKNHREVTIKIGNSRFRVDGYDPDTKTIYEFNGDSWHGNPEIFNGNDINRATKTSYGFLYTRTLNKSHTLSNSGYNVVSIWESDFDKEVI